MYTSFVPVSLVQTNIKFSKKHNLISKLEFKEGCIRNGQTPIFFNAQSCHVVLESINYFNLNTQCT